MDEITDLDSPQTPPSNVLNRDSVQQRAAIVCAVYDVYSMLKGIEHPKKRNLIFAHLPQSKEEAQQAFARSSDYIAERIGERVLFAPVECFDLSQEELATFYPEQQDSSTFLNQSWLQFCNETNLLPTSQPLFRTSSDIISERSVQAFVMNPTHCRPKTAKIEGWGRFLDGAFAAIGYDDYGNPNQAAFLDVLPGDLICCCNGNYGFRGIGVALSAHKHSDSPFYYAGIDPKSRQDSYYHYYIDVAWLAGGAIPGYFINKSELKLDNVKKWDGYEIFEPKNDLLDALHHYLLDPPTESCTPSTHMNLAKQLEACHNLILTGPPGTGKTHLAREIAEFLQAESEMVQFHPSYDYTDFVEGLRPTEPNENGMVIGFERQDGTFKAFCKKALRAPDPETKHIFIIDEINRGELSRIFGELFFVLDPDYRTPLPVEGKAKHAVRTQFQQLITKTDDDFHENKGGFYVPENVYIIGTMNDIDRSVESMDFAIRRRFTWHAVAASDTAEEIIRARDPKTSEPIIPEGMQDPALAKLNALNAIIGADKQLGPAYEIGGAYFAKLARLEGDATTRFQALWDYHLHGLLAEYLRGRSDAPNVMKELANAYGVQS